MTVQDPSTGRYVNTDRNAVKRGDQNFAVIGPARLSSEEETQQQIDKGIPPANIVNIDLGESGQTVNEYGEFHPNLWYTQQNIGINVALDCPNDFIMNSLFASRDFVLNEFVFLLNFGGDASLIGSSQVQFQIGLYTSLYGLPHVKIFESSVYDLATISSGTRIRVPITLPLSAGKYFVVAATGGGADLPSIPQRPIMYHRTNMSGTIFNPAGRAINSSNPSTSSGIGISEFTLGVDNSTLPSPYVAGAMPNIIDFTDSTVRSAFLAYSYFPDIYMNFN